MSWAPRLSTTGLTGRGSLGLARDPLQGCPGFQSGPRTKNAGIRASRWRAALGNVASLLHGLLAFPVPCPGALSSSALSARATRAAWTCSRHPFCA